MQVRSWVGKIPWRRAWQPTPVFLPGDSPWTEEPGGGGYSPWGRMESDTTELLSSSSIRVPQAWTWFVGVLSLPVTSDSR